LSLNIRNYLDKDSNSPYLSLTMVYQILIVEDEPLIAAELSAHLTAANFYVTAIVTTGEAALSTVAVNPPDAIIMDIRLAGELDGVVTAHLLNERYSLPVVFLTANTDRAYYERARATFPLAFVSKPYDPEELVRNLEILVRRWGRKDGTSQPAKRPLFYRERGELRRFELDEIHYIAAAGNYCDVFTEKQRITVNYNLKQLLLKLPASNFCRIHRSYCVNLHFLIRITESEVATGAYRIPLAQSYRNELLARLERI
ncbi:MAG: response regulator, partial [Bacteroidota bacterium]